MNINYFCYSYADDIVLILEDNNSLHKVLEFTLDWCKYNKIDLNLKKCGIMTKLDIKLKKELKHIAEIPIVK